MSHVGVGPRAVVRSAAFLTAGALAVTVLTGCGGEDEAGRPLAGQDIAQAARGKIADGGTLRWAVDAVPDTLNTFQADADAATTTVAQATLPSMYTLDELGRPQRNADYLESAKVVETEPKQVVLYKLNQQAVWSDGREIGAADFAAQWRALSGKDSAYWTARNAGYDRIEKVERGDNDLEVKVTFSRPYADWRSLFSPLYPKEVMGTPDSFNDGARRKLKVTAGPFNVKQVDVKAKDVVLTRNPRWWGEPAKLEKIVLHAVPRDKRVDALAEGAVDLAPVDAVDARRITGAARGNAGPLAGPGRSETEVLRDWGAAHGFDEDAVDSESGLKKVRKAMAEWHMRESMLRGFEVRKSFEPAYTQLALNGSEGPLADERVRRAVARALDRKALAELVLKPLGLPAVPVGSHLALSGQAAYADNSGALGDHDTGEAQALLADAGWVPGGPVEEPKKGEKAEKAAGGEAEKSEKKDEKKDEEKAGKKGDKAAGGSGADGDNRGGASASEGDDGTYIVGQDGKARRGPDTVEDGAARTGGAARDGQDEKPNGRHGEDGTRQLAQDGLRGGAPGAYAPQGHRGPGRCRAEGAGQGRQGAVAEVRRPVRPRLGDAAHGGRPDRADAGEGRHPHRDHQGRRQQLLQGPHRVRPVRPRPVLVARNRLPGHRCPAHLRQAGPGRRRLADRGAELHAGRHRPGRPAVRAGDRHAGRGRGPRSDPQGRLADLGGGGLDPAVPAAPAGRGPQEPGERGRLRVPHPRLPGHGLPQEGREALPVPPARAERGSGAQTPDPRPSPAPTGRHAVTERAGRSLCVQHRTPSRSRKKGPNGPLPRRARTMG
ncbi:hypothetical protein GCM10020256_25680 [Streptomyces thermocoprophilus]